MHYYSLVIYCMYSLQYRKQPVTNDSENGYLITVF